jgi:hypothetical protein
MSSTNENVQQIVAMGFPEDQAILALNRTDNNVNLAVELLSNGSEFLSCQSFVFVYFG